VQLRPYERSVGPPTVGYKCRRFHTDFYTESTSIGTSLGKMPVQASRNNSREYTQSEA